jgi:hypothetical protein
LLPLFIDAYLVSETGRLEQILNRLGRYGAG